MNPDELTRILTQVFKSDAFSNDTTTKQTEDLDRKLRVYFEHFDEKKSNKFSIVNICTHPAVLHRVLLQGVVHDWHTWGVQSAHGIHKGFSPV